MRANGEEPALPDLSAPYLAAWWLEIGPVGAGGDSLIAWSEIEAWQRLTGIEPQPWEARLIRQLSSAYLGQQHDARKPDCPAPYSNEAKRDRVGDQFGAMFKAVAGLQNGKRRGK